MAKTNRKLTRAEKSEITRRNLLEAAVEVVGERGYVDASVTSITTRANIAQGTFYNYFESKQDILDQLLPELGKVLLSYLGEQVSHTTYLEREERSLRAYFDFVRQHPSFYRILLEAQIYSPDSYARHAQNLTRSYVAALGKNKANGYLQSYAEEEFETLAVILLGARVQLMSRYCFRNGRVRAIPEHVIGTFMKFLEAGFGDADPKRKSAATRPVVPSPPAPGPAVPTHWYSGHVLAATGNALSIRYDIEASPGNGVMHSPDRALQELVADLLDRTVASAAPTDAHVRSNHTLLFARQLPSCVDASCRFEPTSRDEGVAEFVLADATNPSGARLASGQAVLGFIGSSA